MLRDISARNTLAGARVVMLNPPRRGKRKPEYLQWLASLHGRRAMPMRYLFIWNAARLTCGFRLGAPAQRRRDARIAATAWLYSGWYSLLNAPVAARWQRKFSTH
ncbi:selenocysteinyl-tRNA-specific translation factor [Escherichia coli]|uniref:Selenocysteinyl-tRNA-specific translation factor n=1 Tax=Escherichia coli TaxID=562 RepID=A0A377AN18_ECOLX|nr:selenocysteinyl-tRNA-specific translation factor [Escherichia coli]